MLPPARHAQWQKTINKKSHTVNWIFVFTFSVFIFCSVVCFSYYMYTKCDNYELNIKQNEWLKLIYAVHLETWPHKRIHRFKSLRCFFSGGFFMAKIQLIISLDFDFAHESPLWYTVTESTLCAYIVLHCGMCAHREKTIS